jgi:ribosomal protein S18 acetylase RimI-like enzyme
VTKLRALGTEDWPQWREMRLAALFEAPYAFDSTLAEWQGDGDTAERWRDRLANVPFNVIADLDSVPAGMVSATAADETGAIELISMWVAPFARGSGVGDSLIAAVTKWAKEQGAARILLDVMKTNEHAIKLYKRHGFVDLDTGQCDLAADPPQHRMLRDLS